MHIEEIRKELTREEFEMRINKGFFSYNGHGYCCPIKIGLKNNGKCNIGCDECWKNSIKNIKFKEEITIHNEQHDTNDDNSEDDSYGYFPYFVGDTVDKECAVYIIENGGKIENYGDVYFLNGDQLVYKTNNDKIYNSLGFEGNFFDGNEYIIVELPKQFQTKQKSDLSKYTMKELIDELSKRMCEDKQI